MKKTILLLTMALLAGNVCKAESDNNKRTLTQKKYPVGYDNTSFAVFYFNGKNAYNNRGMVIFSGDTIKDLKINPSFSTVASLEKTKKGGTYAETFRVGKTIDAQQKIKVKNQNLTALAYSADARQLAIATSAKQILFYDVIGKKMQSTATSEITPQKMIFSGNNFFLAAIEGKTLEIWNVERKTIRKTINFDSKVNDVAFADNNSKMLVVTADGKLTVYDTATFNPKNTIEDAGSALACQANNNGKYAYVLYSPSRICVINLLDPTERQFIDDVNGGISTIRGIYNYNDNNDFIIYNTSNALVYQRMEGLTPYYNKMMSGELNEKLNQWMKQMPGESLEEYTARVNEESRREMAMELEREIATKMAVGLLEQSDVTVGDYNTKTKKLTLHFSSMPDIFLDVPLGEIKSFDKSSRLEFRNVKYGLNPDDKFEIVYAEVYNPENGKTYIFDNLERKSLSYMMEDANFVPIDVIQATSMEEIALESIKEDIISLAKQEQTISDKTHISVNTHADPAIDADGKNIINYSVEFTYEVEEEFSARDDFKPGHYHTEESGAAMSMLKIMKKAFENDFAKYIAEGKRVKIAIKGTADASPIAHAIAYDGKYGEFDGEPVFKNKEMTNVSLNKKDGIATNDQLAFARAIGVQHYIEKELASFEKMNRNYEYHIEVSEQEGSKFRRISVQCTFIDAF